MIERIKIERIPEVSAYKLSHAVSKLRFLKGADKAVLRAMCDRYPMCFPDVDDLGQAETLHKRGYRVLRIPRSALNRFVAENRAA